VAPDSVPEAQGAEVIIDLSEDADDEGEEEEEEEGGGGGGGGEEEEEEEEEGIDDKIEAEIELGMQEEYEVEMEMYRQSLEDGLETGGELDNDPEHSASTAQNPSNLPAAASHPRPRASQITMSTAKQSQSKLFTQNPPS
jgi:hypothetical protein